jgi:hypothetical protein
VVRLFTKNDIDPERLRAIGYGENQPVASNQTEQGRAKNRRVTVVVLNRPNEKSQNLFDKDDEEKPPESAQSSDAKSSSPKLLVPTGGKPKITTLPKAKTIDPKSATQSDAGRRNVTAVPKPVRIPPPTPIQLPTPGSLPVNKEAAQ